MDGKALSINENVLLKNTNIDSLDKLFKKVKEECEPSLFQFSQKQDELLKKFAEHPEKLNINERYNLYETLCSVNQTRSIKSIFSDMLHDDFAKEFLKKNNLPIDMEAFSKLSDDEQGLIVDKIFDNTRYKLKTQDRGSWGVLNHEFGHKLHRENVGQKLFDEMSVSCNSNKEESKDKMLEYAAKFREKYPNAYVLENVTTYATFSEGEAVAEIFAGRMNGMKYNDEIMDLYQKWRGPSIA